MITNSILLNSYSQIYDTSVQDSFYIQSKKICNCCNNNKETKDKKVIVSSSGVNFVEAN